MKIFRFLCVVSLLLVTAPAIAADTSTGTGPTLAETLSWMDYTYNPHPSSGSFGHGIKETYDPSSNANLFSRIKENFVYKDCQMILHIQDDPNSSLSGIHTDTEQTFDLHDIDPKSIQVHTYDSRQNGEECRDPEITLAMHMDCDSAEIQFATRGQLPLISTKSHAVNSQLQGADHDVFTKSNDNNGVFEVNNADYADRFARALARAIDLCSKKQ